MKKTLILFLLMLWSVCASAQYYYIPRFDPNQDGVSDVGDVTAVVDCVLNHGNIEGVNGDVDRNGSLFITDVVLMIDYLFHPGNYDHPKYEPYYPEFEIPEGAEIYEANGVSFAMAPIDTVDESGNIVHKLSMGVTEVTIELWQAVMGNNPTLASAMYDFITPRWPVSHVSWYNCQDFIARLNELTGQQFRLPTSDEWKYAASGGLTGIPYQMGWMLTHLPKGFESVYGGCPVGLFLPPNGLGLYDMSGNVAEWCSNGSSNAGLGVYQAYVAGGDVYLENHYFSVGTYFVLLAFKDECQGTHGGHPMLHGLRLAM